MNRTTISALAALAGPVVGSLTDTTDIQSTDNGRPRAELLRPALSGRAFTHVRFGPLGWARETCELVGMLRVLAARWLGLPAGAGQHFLLDTGTLNVLDHYRGIPAPKTWNPSLAGYVSLIVQRKRDAAWTATTPSHVGGRRHG